MGGVESTISELDSLSIIEGPSSISDIITNIKKNSDPAFFVNENEVGKTFLKNYITVCDERGFVSNYIEAMVDSDSLDTGSDPTEMALKIVHRYKAPGDSPGQYISKKLGGDGHLRNVYQMNPKNHLQPDFIDFEAAKNRVYLHVKNGENKTAKLFFGVIFKDLNEERTNFWHPLEIHYQFILYDNDQISRPAIEGSFKNEIP